MKKFRFRLDRILQLKAHAEKEKQKIFGMAVRKVVDQESELKALDNIRTDTQNNQRRRLSGGLDIPMMSSYSRYYLLLKKKELGGLELLKAYKKDQEEKRRELVEAAREKKTFEKLKENKFDSYRKDVELNLQKEQDEIASQMLAYSKSSRQARELLG
ncbi:MAG: flagellar export protein FliJ [Candidatus Zixiibacteriota bacterium]|nr:MAG: flagellar export protein FliJ [candidate division Zixibacteria bacterium]